MGKELLDDDKGNNKENKYDKYRASKIVSNFEKDTIQNLYKPFIKTGFDGLDKLLGGGFAPGWVVLGAIPNLGKSTFVLQLAFNIAEKDKNRPVFYFSLEMPAEWLVAKCISRLSLESFFKRGEKNMTTDTYQKDEYLTNAIMARDFFNEEKREDIDKKRKPTIEDAITRIGKLNNLMIIDPYSSSDPQKAENPLTAKNITKMVNSYSPINDTPENKPLVIIDYLQLIPPADNASSSDDFNTINQNIRDLKEMDKDITLLTISSFNRNSYKTDKGMDFGDFRGSGNIEYSADVVLGLQFSAVTEGKGKYIDLNKQKSKNPRQVDIIALKQRYSGSGAESYVRFDYYPAYDCFMEPAETEKKDQDINYDEKDNGKEEHLQQKNPISEKDTKESNNTNTNASEPQENIVEIDEDTISKCMDWEDIKDLIDHYKKRYPYDENNDDENNIEIHKKLVKMMIESRKSPKDIKTLKKAFKEKYPYENHQELVKVILSSIDECEKKLKTGKG